MVTAATTAAMEGNRNGFTGDARPDFMRGSAKSLDFLALPATGSEQLASVILFFIVAIVPGNAGQQHRSLLCDWISLKLEGSCFFDVEGNIIQREMGLVRQWSRRRAPT